MEQSWQWGIPLFNCSVTRLFIILIAILLWSVRIKSLGILHVDTYYMCALSYNRSYMSHYQDNSNSVQMVNIFVFWIILKLVLVLSVRIKSLGILHMDTYYMCVLSYNRSYMSHYQDNSNSVQVVDIFVFWIILKLVLVLSVRIKSLGILHMDTYYMCVLSYNRSYMSHYQDNSNSVQVVDIFVFWIILKLVLVLSVRIKSLGMTSLGILYVDTQPGKWYVSLSRQF